MFPFLVSKFKTKTKKVLLRIITEPLKNIFIEVTTGFEPVIGMLQTPALPLGYVTD